MRRRRDDAAGEGDAETACPAGGADGGVSPGQAEGGGFQGEGREAEAEGPEWPPLVHAPDVDRATLLRRICGG